MFFSQLKNDWPLDTNHENLYFSSNVTLRGKGLTFLRNKVSFWNIN